MQSILLTIIRLGGMQAVMALAAIVRIKVLATRLGVEGFGDFSQLFFVAQTAAVVVSFGLELGLGRNVGATQDREERQRLFGQANAMNLALSALIVGAGLIVVLFRPSELGTLGVAPTPEALACFVILLLFIPLDAAIRHRVAFLTAIQDIKGLTSGRSIALILATLVSLPVVWYFGLIGAAVQIAIINTTTVAFLDARCRRNAYRPWSLFFSGRTLWMLASFGLASLFLGFTGQAADVYVRSVLITTFGAAQNGIFQSGMSILAQVSTIILGGVVSYALATLGSDLSREGVVATSNRLFSVVVPVAVLAFAGVGLFSGPALIVLYSRDFLPAQAMMPFLLTAEYLVIVVWVVAAPILAQKRLLVWISLGLLNTLCRTGLALLLLPGHGIVGMAIAYLAATLIHLAGNAAFFLRMGYSASRLNLVLIVIGAIIVAGLSWLGSLAVFDLGASAAGLAVLAAFALGAVHALVGLDEAIRQLRRILSPARGSP